MVVVADTHCGLTNQIGAAMSAADLERMLAHCVDRARRAPEEPFVWFAVGRARAALVFFQHERGAQRSFLRRAST